MSIIHIQPFNVYYQHINFGFMPHCSPLQCTAVIIIPKLLCQHDNAKSHLLFSKRFFYAFASPFSVPGIGRAPPGEFSCRAVRISTPSSVTRRVCSIIHISLCHFHAPKVQLTKLSSHLAINSSACPVIGPGDISVLSKSNHGLNSKSHTRLALADSLVLGVVRDVRRAVEKLANSVATVGSNNTAVVLLGVLLDNVAKLSDQCTRLDSLDGLIQALSRCLNHANGIRVSLGLVTNVVSLVQVGVISLVIQRNIDVEDIAVEENTLIRNAVADDFVDGCTARLWEVVVVQWRGVRLSRCQYSRGGTSS